MPAVSRLLSSNHLAMLSRTAAGWRAASDARAAASAELSGRDFCATQPSRTRAVSGCCSPNWPPHTAATRSAWDLESFPSHRGWPARAPRTADRSPPGTASAPRSALVAGELVAQGTQQAVVAEADHNVENATCDALGIIEEEAFRVERRATSRGGPGDAGPRTLPRGRRGALRQGHGG